MAFSLTWLPKILLHAGLSPPEQPGWQNRGRGDVRLIKGVICHHTAGPLKQEICRALGVVTNGAFSRPVGAALSWTRRHFFCCCGRPVQPRRGRQLARLHEPATPTSLG